MMREKIKKVSCMLILRLLDCRTTTVRCSDSKVYFTNLLNRSCVSVILYAYLFIATYILQEFFRHAISRL